MLGGRERRRRRTGQRLEGGVLAPPQLVGAALEGGLVFQQVKVFPVSPLEEIEKSATSVSA